MGGNQDDSRRHRTRARVEGSAAPARVRRDHWKEGESTEDFSIRIGGLANNLRALGDDVPDSVVMRKMLEVVLEHLEAIAFLDLNTVMVEEVTGRLRAVERRRRKPSTPVVDGKGRLLMTQEEWMAKLKIGGNNSDKGSSSGSGSSGSGAGNKAGGSRGRGHGGGGTHPSTGRRSTMGQAKKPGKCKYCGNKGHLAKECRSRLRDEAHLARVAQEEAADSEPTLLMARSTLVPLASSSPLDAASALSPATLARRPVHIVEVKVLAQLDGEAERDDTLWYPDSGATNHMSGCRDASSTSTHRLAAPSGLATIRGCQSRGLAPSCSRGRPASTSR
jgi:hypothetical protein